MNAVQRGRQRRRLLMLGPSIEAPGGMSAVIRSYVDEGLFDRVGIDYISTYEGPGLRHQLVNFGTALGSVLRELVSGHVEGLHLHSASRGSFWRKSIVAETARWFRRPYVFHIHSGEFMTFYRSECGPLAHRWVRRCLNGAAEVFVLTPAWLSEFRGEFPDAAFAVIPNPVAVPAAIPARTSTVPSILFLGRVRPKKGVFDLIEAMSVVVDRVPDARLVIAGDGDLTGAGELLKRLGIEHSVDLVGWIDGEQKERALIECDVFALPSYFEGLPVGVLEAMANGRVVVASRVGGIPDVIESGRNGLLVEPGDVAGLATALETALTDESLRAALVARARQDVLPYAAATVVAQLEQRYQQLFALPPIAPGAGPLVATGLRS